MKQYDVVSLLDNFYINPTPAIYDNGVHSRPLSVITSISIHHDAMQRGHEYDSVDRYTEEATYHYRTLGPGLQYHYKIDNVGTIFKTRPLDEWLYVVGSQENYSTVAICLDGYFHPPYNQQPTREQYEALAQLLTELCEQHPEFPATWPQVRPHRDFSSTACPGDTLAPFVYAINAKADAYNIPDVPYDHPELQPANVPLPPIQPPAPVPVETIGYRVYDLVGKQQGAYNLETNAWNKYLSLSRQAKIVNKLGVDVTATFVAKFEPLVVPQPIPAQPPNPTTADHDRRITALEAVVKAITDFLDLIFKEWRKK